MASKPPPSTKFGQVPVYYEADGGKSPYFVRPGNSDLKEDEVARRRGRRCLMGLGVVLVAAVLLAGGVGAGYAYGSQRNKNKSSPNVRTISTSANSSSDSAGRSLSELKYLPDPGTPEAEQLQKNGSPEVQLAYELAEDALQITPQVIDEFLDFFGSVVNMTDVDLNYYKEQSHYLAFWFRAKGYKAALEILRNFAAGKKPNILELAQTAEQVVGVLKAKGDFKEWLKWPTDADDTMDDGTLQAGLDADAKYRKQASKATLQSSIGGRRRALQGKLDNRREANPLVQLQNKVKPQGWMNNPTVMGYPWFKPIVIPVVFHVLMFHDSQGYLGPRNAYSRGNAPGKRLIMLMNRAYKSANIQFALNEWRYDVKKYKYLNLGSLANWQNCANKGERCTCGLAVKHNKDPRRYINIWVGGSDSYPGLESADIGYSTLIPNMLDSCRDALGGKYPSSRTRHLWFAWDEVDPDYNNNVQAFEDGAATIIHEVGHQLGLLHTHQGDCANQDGIADTPPNRSIQDTDYNDALTSLCIKYFNKEQAFTPAEVKSFHSCSGQGGSIDNINNYMSYVSSACYRLFTMNQVKMMQRIVQFYYNRFVPKRAPKKKATKG